MQEDARRHSAFAVQPIHRHAGNAEHERAEHESDNHGAG